jgi:proteasome assembly chaperone (PAC2) family protein
MADLFSCYFSPQVVIQSDGTTNIVKNSLYYVKSNNTSINKKQIKNLSELDVQLDQSVNESKSNTSLKFADGSLLSSNDLILLTGDSQPVVPGSEYVLSEQLLDLITKFKISNIFSLASYVTGTFVNEPKIYGTATNPEIVKSFRSFNISTLDNGNITGMNGLILGLGKLRGIEGTCLLGETSGYVIDAKASKKSFRNFE